MGNCSHLVMSALHNAHSSSYHEGNLLAVAQNACREIPQTTVTHWHFERILVNSILHQLISRDLAHVIILNA